MANLKKLLLISPNGSPLRATFSEALGDLASYLEVETRELDEVLSRKALDQEPVATVFDCDLLSRCELEQVLKVSDLTGKAPIVALTRQVSLYSYRKVDAFENVVALQKPFDPTLFRTLLERACSGENFKPDVCPRFITDHPARMVILKSGLFVPTRMLNYSAGGAFLEYRGISLDVGDEVQVAVQDSFDDRPSKYFQITARVIWIRHGTPNRSSLRGVGLQFIHRAEATAA